VTARFILSLDCEGRWGMADRLTPEVRRALSDQRLRRAYDAILAVLDRYRIPSTFAFTGMFSLDRATLRDALPLVEGLARDFPDYLGPAVAGIGRGEEGWSGDWALEAVAAAATEHELALHGATHVPWDHPAMTEELARRELASIYATGAPLLAAVSTYVYPRNAVAHRQVLHEHGIAGVRGARLRGSRMANLAAEFDVRTRSDRDPAPGVPLEVPAGYFVNWQAGARRIVPRGVTRARVRNMLEHADRTDGVVHLWLHPENVATAPTTLSLLRSLMADVAHLRDAGRCRILTQHEYCRQIDEVHLARSRARRDVRRAAG
jgi:peptidoglycan/xylan/chitin deacetylase (PgdA/CDA1 family)